MQLLPRSLSLPPPPLCFSFSLFSLSFSPSLSLYSLSVSLSLCVCLSLPIPLDAHFWHTAPCCEEARLPGETTWSYFPRWPQLRAPSMMSCEILLFVHLSYPLLAIQAGSSGGQRRGCRVCQGIHLSFLKSLPTYFFYSLGPMGRQSSIKMQRTAHLLGD